MHPPIIGGNQKAEASGQDDDVNDLVSNGETAIESSGEQMEHAVDFVHAIRKTTMEPVEDLSPNIELPLYNEQSPHPNSLPLTTPASNDLLADAWRYTSEVKKDDYNRWFLFGEPKENIDIASLHPGQAQILSLWQIYLANVDPMLKCTHSPTLQARIIDALGHMAEIPPLMNALMFSIYCVSIMTLADEECLVRFGSSKQNMLAGYQDACQQALLKCKAWRSSEIDALTALYLYLVSLRPHTDPRSLSAILAIVIRNAQRVGLHDEASHTKYPVLEAEMRRRLWWSFIAFDHRICELVEYKTSSLTPLWDCRLPLNVNDFELRSQMMTSPKGHERPTETLFPFVWSQVADSLRHSAFHLLFINPALNALRRSNTDCSTEDEVEFHEAIIEKHLSLCEPDDPLGFMTIWMARGQISRHHLLAYYAKYSKGSMQQTETQRRAALSYALSMLECDTKLRTSPLTKRFLWFINFHVPAIAYFHVINHTRKQPNENRSEELWKIMQDNWNARAANRASARKRNEQMTFEGFAQSVARGWEAFGAALRRDIEDEMLVKEDLVETSSSEGSSMTETIHVGGQMTPDDGLFELGTGLYPNIGGQSSMGVELAHFWTAMDWRFMDPQGW
ncbi:hypothetical protein N0V93_004496 [Gnomoniopsis smithogilvyi]|uniref:Xylanolytic transcriptional activator regulatory domain-containing protein n=1 Tax=Gnomoniopsis smithogilvyi TaxID=1191159 RepID=A0A9W8YUT7_9PEZI|nr:hypothetical protein N0V93_004496 [Gnomoniopsis smithogilvyi]